MIKQSLFCITLLFLGAAPAEARFQPQPCKNSFTTEQELAEGAKAKQQVLQTMPVLPDSSPVSQYVSRLGQKLAGYAPGYKWPYEFHVVNQADINAFALPGGPVFVNLGTVQAADTEAQLAGVMAHEISHVVQRHATCNQSKQQRASPWLNLGALAAGALVPGAGGLAQQGVLMAGGLTFLRMGRDAEKQADLMGTDILYDAGYDPRGMPQFFETIQAKYGNGGAQLLADHPNPGNRTEYVNAEIATLPVRQNPVRNSAEFTSIHKQVSGMHAYTAQEIANGAWKKQGAGQTVEAGVQQPATVVNFTPNGQWTQLHGNGFTLQYPANWKVIDGPGKGTTIAPTGGATATGVAYGAMVDAFDPQGRNLRTAFDALAASLGQGNQGLAPIGAAQDLKVGSLPARSVEMRNPQGAPGGAPERDWLVGMLGPQGQMQYVVFIAPEKDFGSLRGTYTEMLREFQVQ